MPCQLVGVLTQPDRPAGRGRQLQASPVKRLALELGLPVAQPVTLKTEAERAALLAWAPELLVVVAYGLILPPAVLELPRLGCLNIHASLLPRWRGAAPIQRAILAGDATTGISLMRMDAGLDTGPILRRQALPIGAQTTGGELHDALASLGAGMLAPAIEDLAAGRIAAAAATRHRRDLRREDRQGRGGHRLDGGRGRDRAPGARLQSLARGRDAPRR